MQDRPNTRHAARVIGGAALRVRRRTQAITELPLDRSAQECLPDGEDSWPARITPAMRAWMSAKRPPAGRAAYCERWPSISVSLSSDAPADLVWSRLRNSAAGMPPNPSSPSRPPARPPRSIRAASSGQHLADALIYGGFLLARNIAATGFGSLAGQLDRSERRDVCSD